ncbi:MAG: Spy/CpxP family protein refolding chaperone [bacterium]
MKKSGILILIIGCIAILTMAQSALCQNMFPKGKWWKHPEILENLQLSDVQIQKVEEISNENMREIIKLEAEYKIARMDLETLLDNIDQQKLDLKALEKQIDIVNSIRGELEKQRIMMLAKIRNILPAEAFKKLKRLRGRFGKQRGKRGRMRQEEAIDDYERPDRE